MTGAKKNILANTFYTIAGALVLNGVLQLLVYPRLAAELGAERNGTVLYIMAFINILGPSIGQALNNSRLVLRRDMDVSNGDYNTVILMFSAIGIIGTLGLLLGVLDGWYCFVLTAVLILLTNFRYYGDVEYRLSLNYRNYFLYYALCGAGYAAGYLVYRLTGVWFFIFLTGEACALCFAAFGGRIFKRPLERSQCFETVVSKGAVLVLSYFVTNLTLNIDRLFLNYSLGGEAVTIYYVVSLIGKTLVLFIAPVNTIVISYLTKSDTRLDRKRFLIFSGIGAAASAVFFLFCEIATPIFIKLFYPSLAEASKGLVTIASVSQILAMLSAYLFIIVLTFTGEKWQLGLQAAHLALTLVLITCLTPVGGLLGFGIGVLAANAVRVVCVMILGIFGAGRTNKTDKK